MAVVIRTAGRTYSLLAQLKTGVTKRINLHHLVTCHANILWLIYMAHRTNSNKVSKWLFVRQAVRIDPHLLVWRAVRIATSTLRCYSYGEPYK